MYSLIGILNYSGWVAGWQVGNTLKLKPASYTELGKKKGLISVVKMFGPNRKTNVNLFSFNSGMRNSCAGM